MNNKTKVAVKGLANIGQLLNRADLVKAPTAPKRNRRDLDQIHTRTMEKIKAAIHFGANITPTQIDLISNFVRASIRESYNGGHADALDQNSAVEKLLEKQYEARTQTTMPAVVAAVMEQRSLSSMTLDLAELATVFQRHRIDYTVSEQDIIDFKLTPLDEV